MQVLVCETSIRSEVTTSSSSSPDIYHLLGKDTFVFFNYILVLKDAYVSCNFNWSFSTDSIV